MNEFEGSFRGREVSTTTENTKQEKKTAVSRRSFAQLAVLGGVSAFGLDTVPRAAVFSAEHGRTKESRDGRIGIELPQQGPDVLYEPLAEAPQFVNTGVWEAEPLMVSGTDAYVDGEYLYQDYIYDDHGANVTNKPFQNRPEPDLNTFSPTTGNILYPTDFETYAHNAADLLEFRAQPVSRGIAYRFTLNTMHEPDVTGIAVGINTDGETGTGKEWGYGLGDLGTLGLDHVLVTWGTGAELDGSTEDVRSVTVDIERNQIEVVVDREPADETWRHYAVTGLFDTKEHQFKSVQGKPTESSPGHPGDEQNPSLPPVFNVAFRFDEPLGTEIPGYKPAAARSGHWREHAQALALAERDISDFHADIDFAKLSAETTEYNIPRTGYLNRLYVSHYHFGEGVDGTLEEGSPEAVNIFLNRIQPYTVYIPESYEAGKRSPMHLYLHALTSSLNETGVYTPNMLQELGEERNAIILSPEGRGPALGYGNRGQLDVFEAWADTAARYDIDWKRVTVSGYSMGGFGTFRLGAQYPGLFAKGFPIVGAAVKGVGPILTNLRNLPMLMWNSFEDTAVPPALFKPTHEILAELGYRHQLCIFPALVPSVSAHLGIAINDEWGPAKAFLEGKYLGDETIDYTPPQVTYRRVPAMDTKKFGLIHDTAYWVSAIDVVTGEDDGLVDVRSHAFGVSPPVPVDYKRNGTEPVTHTELGTRWKESGHTTPRNALDVTLERVADVTFWIEAANIDIHDPIELAIESTHPATITLAGSFGTETVDVPAGTHETTVQVSFSEDEEVEETDDEDDIYEGPGDDDDGDNVDADGDGAVDEDDEDKDDDDDSDGNNRDDDGDGAVDEDGELDPDD